MAYASFRKLSADHHIRILSLCSRPLCSICPALTAMLSSVSRRTEVFSEADIGCCRLVAAAGRVIPLTGPCRGTLLMTLASCSAVPRSRHWLPVRHADSGDAHYLIASRRTLLCAPAVAAAAASPAPCRAVSSRVVSRVVSPRVACSSPSVGAGLSPPGVVRAANLTTGGGGLCHCPAQDSVSGATGAVIRANHGDCSGGGGADPEG